MSKPLTKKEWEKSVANAWSTAIEATYKDMIEKAVLEEGVDIEAQKPTKVSHDPLIDAVAKSISKSVVK